MVVKKNQQKHQGHAQRNLEVLHRLTQTLAKTWDCDKMVKAFLAEIAAVIDADVVGLVRRTPHRLWMRVKPQQCERADAVRSRLMERLEHQECDAGRAKMPCEERRRRWPGHLSLVSRSNLPPLSQDEQDNNVYEVQLVVSSSVEGLLYIEREPGCAFSGEERQLVQTASALLSLALTSADAHSRLRELDLRDSLTGVFTRDVLDGVLHRELRAGLRYGGSACLLLLDPDYFRTVNERLGHTAGDAVLKRVAALLEENIRDVDSVSRYSGGAFAVVLPHTGLVQAEALAERIRGKMEQQPFVVDGGQVRLTLSIGLAVCHATRGESVGGWIAAAESALHEAKGRGRNCVVTHAASRHTPAQAVLSLVA